jgi:hypothetical protein
VYNDHDGGWFGYNDGEWFLRAFILTSNKPILGQDDPLSYENSAIIDQREIILSYTGSGMDDVRSE